MIAKLRQDNSCQDSFFYTISLKLPNGTKFVERKRVPVKTKPLAETWLQQRLAYVLTNPNPNKSGVEQVTIKQLFETYYDNKKAKRSKASYLNFIQSLYAKHIGPEVGHVLVKTIDAELVHRFYTQLSNALSPASTRNVLNLFKALLELAVKFGYINRLPSFPLVKVTTVEPKILTLSEITEYEENACELGLNYRVLLALLQYTGMRKGEIQALQWDDVDLDQFTITVHRNVWRGVEGTTKNRKTRVIPINPKLHSLLLTAKKSKDIHVCFFRTESEIRTALSKITGNRLQRAHLFRHTFASNLISKNTPITVVKELLGHVDLASTMIYLHTNHSQLTQAVNNL